MFHLQSGEGPKFRVEGLRLPFDGADIGQIFDMTGQVKIDAIVPEGGVYVFEVLNIGFPRREEGTLAERHKIRNLKAQPPTKAKKVG